MAYNGAQGGSSSTTTTVMYQDPAESSTDEEEYPQLLCRALYDYVAQDASALSFSKGDIIEVLTQQPSGWWDGLLGEERGWFPSNYVVIMSDEDVELAFSGSELSGNESAMGGSGSTGSAASSGTAAAAVTSTAGGVGGGPLRTTTSASRHRDSVVDIGSAMMQGSSEENEHWLENEMSGGSSIDDLANASWADSGASSSDFWMPQVASNGQIFYVNTKTGQQSRDLPQEADEDTSDSDLAGLTSQSSSRSGTSAGLGFASDQPDSVSTLGTSLLGSTTSSAPGVGAAMFGVPRRTGTPEPWQRKLADDGQSYYYYNKLDGSTQWTRPQPAIPVTPTTAVPSHSHSQAQSHPHPHQQSGVRPVSVYSDSSELDPRGDPSLSLSHSTSSSNLHRDPSSSSLIHSTSNSNANSNATLPPSISSDLTTAELIAHNLQQRLLPPPVESVADLSARARSSIHAVVSNIAHIASLHTNSNLNSSDFGFSFGENLAAGDAGMDVLIHGVVLAVRNLLYVAGAPGGQIPSNVLPKGYTPPSSSNTHHSHHSQSQSHSHGHSHKRAPSAPLKPAQRKVTATLSRLVLSARAIQYDAGSSVPDTLARIEVDADELDRAVSAFVGEVGRVRGGAGGGLNGTNNGVRSLPIPPGAEGGPPPLKRLHAVFGTENVGLGLPGAGVGGGWTGFGWLSENESEAEAELLESEVRPTSTPTPKRMLTPDVVAEAGGAVTRLEALLGVLGIAVRTPLKALVDLDPANANQGTSADMGTPEVEITQIHSYTRDVIAHLSSFLALVGDIHIAQHVAIDDDSVSSSAFGIDDPSAQTQNEMYLRTLSSARVHERTMEAAVQALYDDAAELFCVVQGLRSGEQGVRDVLALPMPPPYETESGPGTQVEGGNPSLPSSNSSLPTTLSSNSQSNSSSSASSKSSASSLHSALTHISTLLNALGSNTALTLRTLEALLVVGHEQAEVGREAYDGAIGWRTSRASVVRGSVIGALGALGGGSGGADIAGGMGVGGMGGIRDSMYGIGNMGNFGDIRTSVIGGMGGMGGIGGMGGGLGGGADDEVGMEDAFFRPQRPIRIEPNRYQSPPNSSGLPGPGSMQPLASSTSRQPVQPKIGAGTGMGMSASDGYVVPPPRNGSMSAINGNGNGNGYRNGNGNGYDRMGNASGSSDYESEPTPELDSSPESDDEVDKDVLGGIGGAFADDPITPKPPKTSNKAAKILGEEAPPWFLLTDPNAPDINIDTDKSVKGGTVAALVERLTAHDTTDPNYAKAFLMTFKSFTTLDELFDLLVQRFHIQPPQGLSSFELKLWTQKKKNIVQFRVINTFKSMLTDEDILEKEDLYILDRMKEFVLSEEASQVGASKPLLNLIERVQKSGETKRIVVKAAQTAPTPIMPKGSNKKVKLTDVEPLELARQLTLFESALYQKIRPMECLQRAREQKTDSMDNIAFVIQTSNRIADWVAESVLSKEDSRKRAATVKHLILVADRCRTLNNFSTMIAIVSGLNTPPIRRLKRTWEQVSQRHMAQFGACEVTLDSNRNFQKYRSMLASVVPPCVPFIGVFLSTLQFIQDGNKDMLSPTMVNFKKRTMASEVINDIKRWQAHSYNFQVVPIIRDYIEESLSAFDDARTSSDRFWGMSLEREPREREDEKMARLLQESGFL